MNAETMTINPNELVIDMPLDEANVNTKVESMRNNGMIQDVTIWLQDMRIIDGFHRTEAARRLGWEGIRCKVVDCSEAAFWDARIQSARQHHTVEGERLQVWIRECWRNSDWPDVMAVMKDGQIRATNPKLIDMFIANVKEEYAIKPSNRFERWLVEDRGLKYWSELANITDKELLSVKGLGLSRLSDFRRKQNLAEDAISLNNTHPLHRTYKKDDFTTEQELLTTALFIAGYSKGDLANSLTAWFREKAIQWGVPSEEWLIDAIFSELIDERSIKQALYVMHGVIDNPTIGDVIAVERALPIHRAYVPSDEEDEMRLYLRDRQPGETWKNYKARKLEEKRSVWRREQQEVADVKIDKPIRGLEESQRSYMRMHIETARISLQSCGYSCGLVPEAPAMLGEFAQFVVDFTTEHFPDVQIAKPNPVALENSRLRSENAKLKERIASLERALNSKTAAGEMLSSAIAWSSTDIDA